MLRTPSQVIRNLPMMIILQYCDTNDLEKKAIKSSKERVCMDAFAKIYFSNSLLLFYVRRDTEVDLQDNHI